MVLFLLFLILLVLCWPLAVVGAAVVVLGPEVTVLLALAGLILWVVYNVFILAPLEALEDWKNNREAKRKRELEPPPGRPDGLLL